MRRNVDEILRQSIEDEDTLPYELKAEMWNNIERKVVTTRMSTKYRSSHRFSGVLAGIGTVAVLACAVFFGGHYFLTHRTMTTTTASHGGTPSAAVANNTTSNSASPSASNATSNVPNTSNNISPTTPSGVAIHSYASVSQATAAIDAIQQGFGQFYPSGPNVNLGNGISAQQAGATGTLSLKWTEGHWTILTNLSSQTAIQTAQQMVSYLHTHMLPAPQGKGVITVTQSYNSSSPTIHTNTTVAWQVGTKVYEIQQIGNPINALQAAVNHG
ncbi:hypothetical protein [Alicyclobacillus ferrooxydans]|uniref:hypothetical protein n=1 Tax=Alicyclobacillus ferrooxydans TaxID=471514 RepID=UPI0006D57EF3|nr:hypothetical protein [Alicyclobacillus ferrooxydans]